jgi:DNA polymerase-3 subunit epsilon/CBS domain-containing protein
LFGVVSAARAMAIRYGVMERSTPARLAGVKTLLHVSATDLDAAGEAHGVFIDLILSQQIEDISSGTLPSNAVVVKRLSARDQERLRASLEAVASVDQLVRDVLFKG